MKRRRGPHRVTAKGPRWLDERCLACGHAMWVRWDHGTPEPLGPFRCDECTLVDGS